MLAFCDAFPVQNRYMDPPGCVQTTSLEFAFPGTTSRITLAYVDIEYPADAKDPEWHTTQSELKIGCMSGI